MNLYFLIETSVDNWDLGWIIFNINLAKLLNLIYFFPLKRLFWPKTQHYKYNSKKEGVNPTWKLFLKTIFYFKKHVNKSMIENSFSRICFKTMLFMLKFSNKILFLKTIEKYFWELFSIFLIINKINAKLHVT